MDKALDSLVSEKTLLELTQEWRQRLNLHACKKEEDKLREGFNEKKRFLSGIAGMRGGVYPCPIFLALFLEVHFWSIKRVYFFKNANVLNF